MLAGSGRCSYSLHSASTSTLFEWRHNGSKMNSLHSRKRLKTICINCLLGLKVEARFKFILFLQRRCTALPYTPTLIDEQIDEQIDE